MEQMTIKAIPKGEFIKLKDSDTSPVWVRGEYDRASRTYSIYKFDDVNQEAFVRGSRSVFVGFTF